MVLANKKAQGGPKNPKNCQKKLTGAYPKTSTYGPVGMFFTSASLPRTTNISHNGVQFDRCFSSHDKYNNHLKRPVVDSRRPVLVSDFGELVFDYFTVNSAPDTQRKIFKC